MNNESEDEINITTSTSTDVIGVTHARTIPRIDWFLFYTGLALLVRSGGQKIGHDATYDLRLRYDLETFEATMFRDMEYTTILASLVFLGYFGNSIHKPVAMAIGTLLYGLGCLICGSVYFLSGPLNDIGLNKLHAMDHAATCMQHRSEPPVNEDGDIDHCYYMRWKELTIKGSFSLLCLGQLCIGIATSLMLSTPVIYIEENRSKLRHGTTYAYGFLFFCISIGYFLATLLTYALQGLPENVTGERAVLPHYLSSVGPWWLPYLIIAALCIPASVRLFSFPRWILQPKWLQRRIERTEQRRKLLLERQRKQRMMAKKKNIKKKLANKKALPAIRGRLPDKIKPPQIIKNGGKIKSNLSDEPIIATVANFDITSKDGSIKENSIKNNIKSEPKKTINANKGLYLGRQCGDLPKYLIYFITHPVYVLTVSGTCSAAFLFTGYWSQLPFYLKRQFRVDTPTSELVSGLTFSIASMVGIIIASIVIKKFCLNLRNQVLFVLAGLSVATFCILILYSFGCNDSINNDTVNNMRSCARSCNCDSVSKQAFTFPVCSQLNGQYFSSPCVAGCLHYKRDMLKRDNILVYTNCTCSDEDLSTDWCSPCYGHYFGFILFHFIAISAQAFVGIPVVHILLRKVPAELRCLSIGFALWLLYLIAILPGRIIYLQLQNKTCERGTGTHHVLECNRGDDCWLLNSSQYRVASISTTLCLQILGIILFSILYYLMRVKPVKKIGDSTLDVSHA